MSKRAMCAMAALVALAWSTSSAEAGFRHRRCAPTCAPRACGTPTYVTSVAAIAGHYEDVVVERVIYAKEVVTESRTITVTECRPETRQRNYTVCKRVPYKETVTEDYTVMVQKTSMRKVTETVYKPVQRVVDQTYTVMVPHTETRQGVQHVYECRPEQMVRTVCVDRGCWETREIQVPCYAPRMRCGGCGGCGTYAAAPCGSCGGCGSCPPPVQTRCVRVWVPKYEYQQVPYTVMRQHLVAKPYQYNVTVCKPEQRTRQITVCEQVAQQVVKEVPVVTCVPEKKTRTFEVTRYKDVNETKTQNYTVMVPYQVQKTIQVPVVRCVPKTVQTTVRKWVCDPAPACAPGCSAPVDAAHAHAVAQPTLAPAVRPTPAKPAAPLPVPAK